MSKEKIPLFKQDVKITDQVCIRIELIESDLMQIGVVQQTGRTDITEVNNAARMFLSEAALAAEAIEKAVAIGCAMIEGMTKEEAIQWVENQKSN